MAIYSIDYSTDSLVWIDQETITYKSRGPGEADFTDYTISGTVWLIIKKDMLPATSPLLEMDLQVELPGRILETFPALVVKTNDLLQRADGTQWIVGIVDEPVYVDRRVAVRAATEMVS